MDFLKIYNKDGSYNSLLNINYIIKIKDAERTKSLKDNKSYVPIEYYLNGIMDALITEKDYKKLTYNEIDIVKDLDELAKEVKKQTTKKTTKKEKEDN